MEVRSPPRPPPRRPPRRPPRPPPPAQDVPSSQDREWCFLSLNFAEKAKSGVWQGRKLGERPPHRAPPPRSPFPEPPSPSPSRTTASAPSFPRRSKTFHQWAEERKHTGAALPRVVREPHGFGVASPAGPAPGGRPQTVYADRRRFGTHFYTVSVQAQRAKLRTSGGGRGEGGAARPHRPPYGRKKSDIALFGSKVEMDRMGSPGRFQGPRSPDRYHRARSPLPAEDRGAPKAEAAPPRGADWGEAIDLPALAGPGGRPTTSVPAARPGAAQTVAELEPLAQGPERAGMELARGPTPDVNAWEASDSEMAETFSPGDPPFGDL